MGRTVVYIASSLDGYIARIDDDVSWLDPYTNNSEDYGYLEFMGTIGTAIMGARTYEQSLIHPERLFSQIKNYIITRRSLPVEPELDAEFWNGSLQDLVIRIRGESEKDIFIVGGGQIISQFIDAGLVDEIRLFVVPVILHQGIPLYANISHEISLKLVGTTPYQTGIVELCYIPE